MRCPVCEKTIVYQAQEVCTSCQPWACENCGTESKWAYEKRKTPAEISIEAKALMGYAASVGECLDCKKVKALGDMGICHHCAKKKVATSELVCHVCLHKRQPFEFEDANREGECINCGETRILNDERMCKHCFKKTISKDTHLCWGCGDPFIPLNPTDDFCEKCIKDLDGTDRYD